MKAGRSLRQRALAQPLAAGLLLVGLSAAAGCADSDACKGRSETCLSLTLSGSDGVTSVDQLQLQFMRKPKPDLPMMALGTPQELPFKVAVLWPDGPATLSVRALLSGQLVGVSPEFALDLRNGQHQQRKLTLYPPLPGTVADLGGTRPDLSSNPKDLATTPPDLAEVPDMAMSEPDLAMSPPDLAVPPDQSTPTNPDL
jgi:hypothetical protein